jgi:signal peptidase II
MSERDDAEASDETTNDATPAAEPSASKAADKAVARKRKHRPKWKLFWIVAVISLVADQVTKIWARAELPTYGATPCDIPEDLVAGRCGGEAVAVIESFWHWRLSMNSGSAFGLFSSQGQVGRWLLSLVAVAAVAGMVWMLKKSRPDQKALHWALALVAGGAVGNLIDRVVYGVVTDFVLWHWGSAKAAGNPNFFKTEWPVFNIADVALVIGVALMFVDMHQEGKRDREKKRRKREKARAAGLVKDL